MEDAPFPFGPLDIFRLSQYKIHFIYPLNIKDYAWIFLFNKKFVDLIGKEEFSILVHSKNGAELGKVQLSFKKPSSTVSSKTESKEVQNSWIYYKILLAEGVNWIVIYFKFDALVPEPTTYIIKGCFKGKEAVIGQAEFRYQKAIPFTSERIKAIEADPLSVKQARLELGCKYCSSKLLVYSALKRIPHLEEKGYIWQQELTDTFTCECTRTSHKLIYIKESLHGLIGKDFHEVTGQLSYARRYAYSEIKKVVKEYYDLLKQNKSEPYYQKFIENNPVILACFNAKKLFTKPNIIGKFQSDFAILDSRNLLLFIELERPSLKLFKKDGHPTADLMHAYGQVRDWIDEFNKYSTAILDRLNLNTGEVMGVRGVVIAGRAIREKPKHIQRHLSSPPYPDIDFLTLVSCL
jgi:hypothetical protein